MPPKKRRRSRGEGALYFRKADRLWIGAVTYEDEYGQKRRATCSSTDKVTAMGKLRALRAEVDGGHYTPQARMAAAAWFQYWLANIVKGSVEPKTYNGYRQIVENQIVPCIGEKKPLPVTPAVVRGNLKWVDERWSSRMVELTYTVWSLAMAAAKRERIIRINPMDAVTKPKAAPKVAGKALSVDEAQRVLRCAVEANDPMVTRWAFALFLGARQGECLGTRWSALDLDKGTADLSWQLQALPIREGYSLDDPDRFDVPQDYEIIPLHKKFALKRPKTERSTRLVPIPLPLVAILRKWREIAPTNEHDLIWASPKGQPIQPKTDNTAWLTALERAGVQRVRLHDARHTTATLLQSFGVEESVRMAVMGHSTVAAQRVYAHVDQTQARAALGHLDVLLAIGE